MIGEFFIAFFGGIYLLYKFLSKQSRENTSIRKGKDDAIKKEEAFAKYCDEEKATKTVEMLRNASDEDIYLMLKDNIDNIFDQTFKGTLGKKIDILKDPRLRVCNRTDYYYTNLLEQLALSKQGLLDIPKSGKLLIGAYRTFEAHFGMKAYDIYKNILKEIEKNLRNAGADTRIYWVPDGVFSNNDSDNRVIYELGPRTGGFYVTIEEMLPWYINRAKTRLW